jgi:hypothetical protein
MDRATFTGACLLGFVAAWAVFFPLGAKRRACIPALAWWVCLVLGTVACFYGLSHSTRPSLAPRVTVSGKASSCTEKREGRDSKFLFRFMPEGGNPIYLETNIIMPHWGSAAAFSSRMFRIVYLNDTERDPSNEAIDIEILSGDNAGWHDSLDARPLGIWLAIPIGAALGGFGFFGLRYKKNDEKASEDASEEASSDPQEWFRRVRSVFFLKRDAEIIAIKIPARHIAGRPSNDQNLT